jgi:hypothetical protein
MCDVPGNIWLHMWVVPCGEVVSLAACSDAKKKSEKRKVAVRIVLFTVSLNSHLDRISVAHNVTDARQVMHMLTGALQ